MKFFYFLLLFFTPLHSFNMSFINDFSKNSILSASSKILSLYTLSKYKNEFNDTEEYKDEETSTVHFKEKIWKIRCIFILLLMKNQVYF